MVETSLDRLVRTVKASAVDKLGGVMAWEKGFDQQEAVRAARAAFWERGYTATSLTQLMKATRLSKSSLYETFGSKRGLFDAAMQNYLDEVMGPLLASMERVDAGRIELQTWFNTFAAVFRGNTQYGPRSGCLMLNTAMELNELDDEATEKVNQFRRRVRAAMFNALRSIDGDPSAVSLRADTLAAAHTGMLLISRMDPAAAAELADTLAADIASW